MRLPVPILIAGPRYVALCEPAGERLRKIHEGSGPYYGISWSDPEIFVLARSRPGMDRILVFSGDFELKRVLPLGETIDGHQILFHGDTLLATATLKNAILLVDPVSGEKRVWNWTGMHSDVNHINGIGYHDEEHVWISCDNRQGTVSELLLIPIGGGKPVEKVMIGTGSTGTHNVESGLVTASGNRSAIWELGESPAERFSIDGFFFRGLAEATLKGGRVILVGASDVVPRRERDSPRRGVVLMLDRLDFTEMDRAEIPGIGQVYELRSLQPGSSHNRILCPAPVDCLTY